MRARYALLLLLASLAGCTDSLGLGGSCSAEKTEVRIREGRGPDRDSGASNIGGDYSQHWEYDNGHVYDFYWGVSYDGCRVNGPGFDLIPITG